MGRWRFFCRGITGAAPGSAGARGFGCEFDWRGGLNPEGFLDGFDRVEGQIFALCKTEDEIADEVAKLYSRFLREPKVTVRIIDTSGRPNVFLTGGVRNATRFRLMRSVTLQELLVLSGGLTEFASGDVTIFRRPDTSCEQGGNGPERQPRTVRVKISDLHAGDANANPTILTGDIIDVNEAFPIYIIAGQTSAGPAGFCWKPFPSRGVPPAGRARRR